MFMIFSLQKIQSFQHTHVWTEHSVCVVMVWVSDEWVRGDIWHSLVIYCHYCSVQAAVEWKPRQCLLASSAPTAPSSPPVRRGSRFGKTLLRKCKHNFSKGAWEPNPRERQASVWNGNLFCRQLFISSKPDKYVKSHLKLDTSHSAAMRKSRNKNLYP